MNASFLSSFMRVAHQKTGAERALAVDGNLSIIAMLNLQQSDVMSEQFIGVHTIRQALADGKAIITNNAVNDPARAPVTNTNFSDLRVVVVIPVGDYGAVYLDRPIRRGMIARDVVERLTALAQHILQHQQFESTEAELEALYQQIG